MAFFPVNVFRDCDTDRTKYDSPKGYVDFFPQEGVLIYEEIGRPAVRVNGSSSYIYFLHQLVRRGRQGGGWVA